MNREQGRLFKESAKRVDYSLDIVHDITYLYRLVNEMKTAKKESKYFLMTAEKEHNELVDAVYDHIIRKLTALKKQAKYVIV